MTQCCDGNYRYDCCLCATLNTELATFGRAFVYSDSQSLQKSQINVKCTNCEHLNLNEVDLSTVSVDVVEPEDTVVDLGDDIFVELKYPSAYDLISLQDPESSASDTLVATIVASIDGIQTEKERIDASEVSKEELQEFVESMTGQQFKSVSEWWKDSCHEKEIEFECKNCGTHIHRIERTCCFFSRFSYETLVNYYKTNFSMMQHHHYSLTELEMMMPWEREIYVTLLLEYLKEETERRKNQGK